MRRTWPALATGATALATFAFLFQSRLDGIGLLDGAEYALHIRGGGLPHAPGYPVYILLGQALAWLTGDVPLAQHLLNLGALAIAAAALWLTFRDNDRATELAALGVVLALVTSFYARLFTVLPEVLVPNLAMFALLGLAIHRWWVSGDEGAQAASATGVRGAGEVSPPSRNQRRFFWIFLLYGLGVGLHHSLAVTLVALGLLLFARRHTLRWGHAAKWALLGFGLGCLPLLWLFTQSDAPQTYAQIHSWGDFVALMLRQRYGFFNLSTLKTGSLAGTILLLTLRAAAKSFGPLALFFLFLPLARPKWDARLIYGGVSLIVFSVLFIPNANVPIDNATYRNTLYKLLTIPLFLLLYPLFFALREAFRRFPWAFWAALVAAVGMQVATAAELRYRGFQRLERHLAAGYGAIFSSPLEPSGIGDRYKCALFAQPDSVVFGLEYFNRFEAEKRCFVFSPTAFSGVFRSRDEEQLERETFGPQYDSLVQQTGGDAHALLPVFFQLLKQHGYRVFAVYQPDFLFLGPSPLRYRPIGNILEILTADDPPKSDLELREAYAAYLDWLQQALDADHGPHPSVDTAVDLAPSQNLFEYPRFVSDAALAARGQSLNREVAARMAP